MPMLILTAAEWIKQSPPGNEDAARLQAQWEGLHREIMQSSSHAQQILVKSSGHFVQREQPEVIVAAIRQMVEQVRSQITGTMLLSNQP